MHEHVGLAAAAGVIPVVVLIFVWPPNVTCHVPRCKTHVENRFIGRSESLHASKEGEVRAGTLK